MNGVLIIDKPAGITSHDVVYRVRKALGAKRVGHTGTLDPFATGVLVVLVGKATRLARFLDKDEKEYEAELRLGAETDTGDLTGTKKDVVFARDRVTREEIEETLPYFTGTIEQIPPMFSAKKLAGKKLYELARAGKEIARSAVTIEVSNIELLNKDLLEEDVSSFFVRVRCSAGTYIRTLAEDIGKRLGTGAYLTKLRRTRAGAFDISESVVLDEISSSSQPVRFLLPMSVAVAGLSVFELKDDRVSKTLSGMSTRICGSAFADGENVRMVSSSGELIAVGSFDANEKVIHPKVVLG